MTEPIGKKGVLYEEIVLIFDRYFVGPGGDVFLVSSNAVAEAGSVDALLPESMKGATFVGTETCATCHEKQDEEFRLSTHARIAVEGETEGVAQGCEMCHGPGSIHAENGAAGGRWLTRARVRRFVLPAIWIKRWNSVFPIVILF